MKKILLGLAVVVIAGIAWYALSPLFDTKVVNDPSPESVTTLEDMTAAKDDATKNPSEKTNIVTSTSERVPVMDTPAHPASGFVRVVKDGDQAIIRYEDYKTINGPDVRIYLATDLKATDFINLGPIKGTEGNINYPVPEGVDLSRYHYVLTWCEDFSVLFNSADIALSR